jgi:hypothetical protein
MLEGRCLLAGPAARVWTVAARVIPLQSRPLSQDRTDLEAARRGAKGRHQPPSGTGALAVDVTGQVAATVSKLSANHRTKELRGSVRITNLTGATITGPIQVEFDGLPSGVTLLRTRGQEGGPAFLTATERGLAPRHSLRLRVRFRDPSLVRFHPELTVFSGTFLKTSDAIQISMDPNNSLLFSDTTPQGQTIAFYGTKDSTGRATSVTSARVRTADGSASTILFDAQGRISGFLSDTGQMDAIQWTSKSTMVLTAIAPDGQDLASVAYDATTGQVSTPPMGGDSMGPAAVAPMVATAGSGPAMTVTPATPMEATTGSGAGGSSSPTDSNKFSALIQVLNCGKPASIHDVTDIFVWARQDGGGIGSPWYGQSVVPTMNPGEYVFTNKFQSDSPPFTPVPDTHERLHELCETISSVVDTSCTLLDPIVASQSDKGICLALSAAMASTGVGGASAVPAFYACVAGFEAAAEICDSPLFKTPETAPQTPSLAEAICDAVGAGEVTKVPTPPDPYLLGNRGFTFTVQVFSPPGASELLDNLYNTTTTLHVAAGQQTIPEVILDIGKAHNQCNVDVTLADIAPYSSGSSAPTTIVIPASLPVGATGQIPANGFVRDLPGGGQAASLRYAYGGVYKIYQNKQGDQFIVVFNKDASGNVVVDGYEPIIPRDGSLFTDGNLIGGLADLPGGSGLLGGKNVFSIWALDPGDPGVSSSTFMAGGYLALVNQGDEIPQIDPRSLIGYPSI